MKKCCLNCEFCDVSFPDVDIRELKAEDDYLICLNTKTKTDDYHKCKLFKPSKGRKDDLKVGC